MIEITAMTYRSCQSGVVVNPDPGYRKPQSTRRIDFREHLPEDPAHALAPPSMQPKQPIGLLLEHTTPLIDVAIDDLLDNVAALEVAIPPVALYIAQYLRERRGDAAKPTNAIMNQPRHFYQTQFGY
jgi:hypothetical protein